MHPLERTRDTKSNFVPASLESPKSGDSMFARMVWESDGHALSMISALRVLSRAAHPMQRRPTRATIRLAESCDVVPITSHRTSVASFVNSSFIWCFVLCGS